MLIFIAGFIVNVGSLMASPIVPVAPPPPGADFIVTQGASPSYIVTQGGAKFVTG